MALLHMNGWDHFDDGSTVDITDRVIGYKNSSSGLGQYEGGLFGGYAVTGASSFRNAYIDLGSDYTTLIVGARMAMNSAALNAFFYIVEGTNGTPTQVQCGLCLTTTGKVAFFKNTTSTIIATGTTTLHPGASYFIELKVLLSNSGTYEVRINGLTEFSGSTDTTQSATQSARFVAISQGGTSTMRSGDDYYICDNSGGAPLNDFLGVCRIETLRPSSNNSVQFTPLSGSNYQNVDEIQATNDTDYNHSVTAGHVDTFNHGSLIGTPTTIYGVQVIAKARQEDQSVGSYRTKMISGGTTSNGATMKSHSGYTYSRDIYTLDPDTGAAWIAANVNASKIGYELVA